MGCHVPQCVCGGQIRTTLWSQFSPSISQDETQASGLHWWVASHVYPSHPPLDLSCTNYFIPRPSFSSAEIAGLFLYWTWRPPVSKQCLTLFSSVTSPPQPGSIHSFLMEPRAQRGGNSLPRQGWPLQSTQKGKGCGTGGQYAGTPHCVWGGLVGFPLYICT